MNFKNARILGLIVLLVAICMITIAVIPIYFANNVNTSTSDEAAVFESSTAISTVAQTTNAPTTNAETTVKVTTQPATEGKQENTESVTENTHIEEVNVEKSEDNQEQAALEIDNVSNNSSDYELDLLARTIYQEAGICGEYCQWLVGSTVLNLADSYGGIEAVVFDYNTFNVAYSLYNATPSDLSYSVANRLLSGDRDYSVKAFRTDYYHSFGTPYTSADNVYFSTY